MTETSHPSVAFTSGHYNYEEAIKLYDKEIEEKPSNFAAYNNRGLCKVHLGSHPYDADLIKDGMKDFNTAIDLAKEQGSSFESAQHNLAFAVNMLRF